MYTICNFGTKVHFCASPRSVQKRNR